jgi:hypothetical protein
MTRDYYNRRVGRGERPYLTLIEAAKQVAALYTYFEQQGYLQRSFGYDCVDAGEVPGLAGTNLASAFYLETGIRVTGRMTEFIEAADEVALFTLLEFVSDHVAKPKEGSGSYHSWSSCGWHFDCRRDKFDVATARLEWREKLNMFLKFYEDGFQLSAAGEIVHIAPDGLAPLGEKAAPSAASNTDREKVANAVHIFNLGRSNREQRKQAVRDLVDVLEFHRSAVKANLSKDEGDLFNIANNFALRHHRADQRDDYDDAWLTWLFYLYLATVHLTLGRVHGLDVEPPAPTPAEPPANDPSDWDDVPF